MAKPILVIRTSMPPDLVEDVVVAIKHVTDNEYHVLMICDDIYKEAEFECLNDCKGLPDVDIEKLIEEFKNNKYGQSS